MKLSVLLSAYNGSNYLREQLNSIVNQSMKPYELILIDDCSQDNGKTWEIFQEYKSKYDFIKTYKNKNNFGYEKSFMNGLNVVTGDVVLFSDHDDIWHTNKLKIMNEIFENNNTDGVLSAVNYKIEVPKAYEFKRKNNIAHTNKLILDKFNFDNQFIHTKGEACALAINMSFVKKYEELWVEGYAHDDFWECMLITFGKLAYYDGALVTRRIHKTNETALKKSNKELTLKYLKMRQNLCNKMLNSTCNNLLNNKQQLTINKYLDFSKNRIQSLENKSLSNWWSIKSSHLSFYNNKLAWFRDLLWLLEK